MDGDHNNAACARRHIRFGWWALLVFLSLGMGLEAMHGLKIGWYVDPPNETRRLLWTLAHAHGTLLGMAHVIFGLSLQVLPELDSHRLPLISFSLIGASVLLPGGFLLGGITFYSGDPGLGIAVVPVGATLLLLAVLLIARSISTIVSKSSSQKKQ